VLNWITRQAEQAIKNVSRDEPLTVLVVDPDPSDRYSEGGTPLRRQDGSRRAQMSSIPQRLDDQRLDVAEALPSSSRVVQFRLPLRDLEQDDYARLKLKNRDAYTLVACIIRAYLDEP
jgi:hypothetical protein